MKKTYIVALRTTDHTNGRNLLESIDGMTFGVGVHIDKDDSMEVKRAIDTQLELDDDNGVSVFEVCDFVSDFNYNFISNETHHLGFVTVLLQPQERIKLDVYRSANNMLIGTKYVSLTVFGHGAELVSNADELNALVAEAAKEVNLFPSEVYFKSSTVK